MKKGRHEWTAFLDWMPLALWTTLSRNASEIGLSLVDERDDEHCLRYGVAYGRSLSDEDAVTRLEVDCELRVPGQQVEVTANMATNIRQFQVEIVLFLDVERLRQKRPAGGSAFILSLNR